jgi:hypothetical protein
MCIATTRGLVALTATQSTCALLHYLEMFEFDHHRVDNVSDSS